MILNAVTVQTIKDRRSPLVKFQAQLHAAIRWAKEIAVTNFSYYCTQLEEKH